MPKKRNKKVSDPKLQYLGNRIKAARNDNHLTQQALADQAGIGLRHYQNIEGRLINPSYKVLSSIIHRLAMPTDILFYPDIGQLEEEESHLLSKFAACTEEERRFLLNTVDCMVEQFISRRQEEKPSEGRPEWPAGQGFSCSCWICFSIKNENQVTDNLCAIF